MTRVDALIIGAGIHGIAVAYEAARRGRSFCLVDRDDIGAGASSNSLKILHGGLRYLQSLDLGRSRESVEARRRVMALAPELVRPLRCRLDLTGRGPAYGLLFRAGLILNDLVTRGRNRGVRKDRHLPQSEFPCWYDALVEDTERLMLGLLRDAAERVESVTYTHTAITELVPGTGGWRATLADRLASADARVVHARSVVRCTGAHREGTPVGVSMNLVVDPLALTSGGDAVALTHPTDGRNVFAVPWRGVTMIGTWDRAYPHDPREPLRFDPTWVDEILAWLAPVHAELRALTRSSVRLVHAGLLPLARPGGSPEGRASVRHTAEGIVDVVGVKYTTALGVAARAMQALDELLGAAGIQVAPEMPLEPYADVLARFTEEDPSRGEPLAEGSMVTRGAVELAVRHEHARTLTDVLLRRIGAATAGHPGAPLVHAVAQEMQRHLDWPDGVRQLEVDAFDADWHFAGRVPSMEPR